MLHPAQTGIKTEESLSYGRDGDEVHPDYEDEQYDKFLSIPFVENEENDEESLLRRMTSSRLSRFVGCGILITAIAALATALAYYVHLKDNENTTDDTPVITDTCYINPSCLNVNINQVYDSNGFTNNTGWSADTGDSCCNICLPGMNSTVCFTSSDVDEYKNLGNTQRTTKKGSFLKNRSKWNTDEGDCKNKDGYEDYDYVMLDQIWFPQWCSALAAGHDPTLSHLQGTLCTPNTTSGPPQLNIHGLWPNYLDGYPQCCKRYGYDSVATLDPVAVKNWDAYSFLQTMWYDPTTLQTNEADLSCATCYLLNHEWEKHGSCYSAELEEMYFGSGIEIALALSNQTYHIQQMNGTVVETNQIVSMYNHTVNVICDPKAAYVPTSAVIDGQEVQFSADDVGVFLEVQSCWNVVITSHSVDEILSDEDGSLFAEHQEEGGTGTLIVDSSAEARERGSRVSVSRDLAGWRESLKYQYGGGSNSGSAKRLRNSDVGVFDFATFYGRNCTAAFSSTFTKPCSKYAYIGNYNNA